MLRIIDFKKLEHFGFKKHNTANYWFKEIETSEDELDVCVIADDKGFLYINALVDKASQNGFYVFKDELSEEDRPSDYLEEGYFTNSQCETNIDLDLVYDLIINGVVIKC